MVSMEILLIGIGKRRISETNLLLGKLVTEGNRNRGTAGCDYTLRRKDIQLFILIVVENGCKRCLIGNQGNSVG